jgi:serpin B
VTMADMNLSMDSPAPTISELRFDHPFGYVLKEKSTGAILFAGRVDKPTI